MADKRKVPHRRPKLQVAGTYATPMKQNVAELDPNWDSQNRGLHYTGSHLIPHGPSRGERIHLMTRENVGIENKPNFETFRFRKFGKKWREVDAKGKAVDPDHTQYITPNDKIEGWSGLVVEDIDPVVGKVKYRQYVQSPIAQAEEKAFKGWLEEFISDPFERELRMKSPFERTVLKNTFKAEMKARSKNREAAANMFQK